MGIASFQHWSGTEVFCSAGPRRPTALLEAHELAEATLGADNLDATSPKLVVALYEEQCS